MTDERPRQRFQLSLLDLLVIVLFTGLWLGVFARCGPLPRTLDDTITTNPAKQYANTIFILFISMGMAIVTLWLSHWSKHSSHRQTLALTLVMGGAVPGILFLSCVHFTAYQRESRVEVQYSLLRGLVAGQQAYQADCREYATTISAMGAYCRPPAQWADGPFRPGARTSYGYLYKVLTAQGDHAAGGRRDYLTTDAEGTRHLTGGFAFLAVPFRGAEADIVLMMDQNCALYARPLPGDPARVFEEITEFDPDEAWTLVYKEAKEEP